jgi:hypothetical protein
MAHNLALQSAMEYLMTYGWAILIIAIVLGVLYYLGVFSPSIIGPTCVSSSSPYLCQSPSLSANGLLSFTLGQSSSVTDYNVGLSCAASSTSQGYPYSTVGGNVFWYPASNGVISSTANAISPSLTLLPRQQIPISGLPCYAATGATLGNIAIGTSFTGTLWYNYTSSNTAPSASNQWYTAKFGTVSIKAT